MFHATLIIIPESKLKVFFRSSEARTYIRKAVDVIGSIYYLVFGFKGECANLVLRFKEKCTICRGELKNGDLLRQTSKIAICRGEWENRDSARAISF